MSQEGQIIEVILQSAGTDGQGLVLARGGVGGQGPQDLRETIEDVVASGSLAQVRSHLDRHASRQEHGSIACPNAVHILAAVMDVCGREVESACMLNSDHR